MSNTIVTERLRERRYRLLMRTPLLGNLLWRYIWRKGTWEVTEVAHLQSDGSVVES